MGQGCKSVSWIYTENTDIVAGLWNDNRIGTFRGIRSGIYDIGGTAFGEKANCLLGNTIATTRLLIKIIEFFKTGMVPVTSAETIEIFAFMAAAEESKFKGGIRLRLKK